MLSPDFLFPRFLVFPPANPSNFSHCKCFSIRILISSASQPVLKKNRIFGGKAAGIEVTNGGGGVIEENEVFDNYFDGICLATGVGPTLRGVCVTKGSSDVYTRLLCKFGHL